MKLLTIYFRANDPRKSVDWSIPTMFPHKEQKEELEKRLQHRRFLVNLLNFLEHPFLRTPAVADSEDEHNETKDCTWHPDWTIEWFIMSYFGNPSKWARCNIFSIAGQKLRWCKTKWIIPFLYSCKKFNLFLEGGAMAPDVPPQLRHWYFAELRNSSVTSSLHSSYKI